MIHGHITLGEIQNQRSQQAVFSMLHVTPRDNVEWGEDQEIVAREAIQAQKLVPVSPDEQGEHSCLTSFFFFTRNRMLERLNATPERFWDKFYANV